MTDDDFRPDERPACPRNDDECSDMTPCASCPHRHTAARLLLAHLLTDTAPVLRAATSGSA